MHLVEQLRLVLGYGAFNLGSHQQLVVVVEDLEHFVGCDCLGELLLQELGQLRLNFGCAAFVGLLRLVPVILSFLSDVEDVIDTLHKVGEGVSDVAEFAAALSCLTLRKRGRDDRLELVVLGPEHHDLVQSVEDWVIHDLLKAILDLATTSLEAATGVGDIASQTGLELIQGQAPLLFQFLDFDVDLFMLIERDLHDGADGDELFQLRVKVARNALRESDGPINAVLLVVVEGAHLAQIAKD